MRTPILAIIVLLLAACTSVPGQPAATPAVASARIPHVRNLAPTPPMGFNNWVSFGCDVSEQLITGVADKVVALGLRDAGYRYINVDDCWEADTRDVNGNLQADPERFPHGMKWLADYMHARGLKFGIYSSIGDTTCTGHLGSGGHYEADMKTFAAWGVDYLKMDGCGYPPGFPELTDYKVPPEYCARDIVEEMRQMYEDVAFAIEKHAPNMIHAVSAPVSLSAIYADAGCGEQWTRAHYERALGWADDYGQLWRAEADSQADWTSMLSTYEQNIALADFQRPGRWNDADSLSVGDAGKLTSVQEQTQFTLWAIMASPLLISANLDKLPAHSLAILRNRDIIAVNQDTAGLQGRRVQSADGLDVIVKPLANGDRAVVLFNKNDAERMVATDLRTVGFAGPGSYRLVDLVSQRKTRSGDVVQAEIPAHGTVIFRVGR